MRTKAFSTKQIGERLILALVASCVLLPSENLGALAQGFYPNQYQSGYNNRSGFPQQNGQPVEQWSGGRYNGQQRPGLVNNGYANQNQMDPDMGGGRGGGRGRNKRRLRKMMKHFSNQQQFADAPGGQFPPAGQSAPNVPMAGNSQFHRPDKFAASPNVGPDGVRHFGNGKHFDLSQMPLQRAIDLANSSRNDQ
ncbi:MAG: hypothetical protein ACRD3W_06585 [Terriglobales bacterium]